MARLLRLPSSVRGYRVPCGARGFPGTSILVISTRSLHSSIAANVCSDRPAAVSITTYENSAARVRSKRLTSAAVTLSAAAGDSGAHTT